MEATLAQPVSALCQQTWKAMTQGRPSMLTSLSAMGSCPALAVGASPSSQVCVRSALETLKSARKRRSFAFESKLINSTRNAAAALNGDIYTDGRISAYFPTVVVGTPGQPTILQVVGSKNIITFTVEPADDTTMTYSLATYTTDSTEEKLQAADYLPNLVDVTTAGNGKQTVMFAKDVDKLGGTFKFKVRPVCKYLSQPNEQPLTN